ncbi:MAG: 2OG-Fe(II) oxygenase, partial [Pseudomonadota bacterium]
FPPYAAVFYLNIPAESEGGAIWFPEIKQGVIPQNNRLAIFDARLAHTVLPIVASAKKPRVVMVLNLWDYATRDEQFELSNGVCGYTEDRRSELTWHS